MAISDIIFYLNLASAIFAALAVIFAIAAMVITFLYHPFRQELPPVVVPPEPIQVPKKKQVIVRIDNADIQTMKQLFEVPKTNDGWFGTTEGKEANV